MNAVYAIPILVIIALGISLNEANAELVGQEAYLVEGTGFAVTEDSIKISEIDFLVELDRQVGTSTSIINCSRWICNTRMIMDFFVSDITGTVLNDGRFIRIAGTASNDFGDEVSISFFGRLIVEDSTEGSVYSFTGRISEGFFTNKIIYTSKVSQITSSSTTDVTTSATTTATAFDELEDNEIIVTLLKCKC